MHTTLLAATLDALHLGTPVIVDNLAMIPLLPGSPSTGDTRSPPRTSPVSIRRTLRHLSAAKRLRRGLAIAGPEFPAGDGGTPSTTATPLNYDVLDEALTSGDAEITEVSEAGVVP